LSSKDKKNKIVEGWLSKSEADLESAKVLYERKLFDTCLYHLQQSNEKLAKALLLSSRFSTPKIGRRDWAIQSALGFLPKEPRQYGHRILPHFLSDLEKSVPSIQEFMAFVMKSEFRQKMTEFSKTIKKSGKNIKKLKKRPLVPIRTTEQLEKEITAVQSLIDKVDPITNNLKEEMGKLDYAEIVRVATLMSKREGFKLDAGQVPSFEEVEARIVSIFRLSMLTSLSVSLSALLDPLVSATRYPDLQPVFANENDPYVKNFHQLYDVISRILKMSRQLHDSSG